jgi:hypothetical protein
MSNCVQTHRKNFLAFYVGSWYTRPMKKATKPYTVISENQSEGNSFGDRTFKVTVELRNPTTHEVLATKTFQETACEGEHGYYKNYITKQIKAWARENGSARFTGAI